MEGFGDLFRQGWATPRSAVFPPLAPVNTGYQLRAPLAGEATYFQQHPAAAGMATGDRMVAFNPSWEAGANPVQKQGLFLLESARNHMKTDDSWRGIEATPQQQAYFASLNDGAYSQLGNLMKQTLVSRIIGGDQIPGAPYTEQQRAVADGIMRRMLGSASR